MSDWVKIKDWDDYFVRDDGTIVNAIMGHPKPLTQSLNQGGHPTVAFYDGVKQIRRSVATIVAKTFLDPPPYPQFDSLIHLDGDKENCHADNLMWRPRAYAINYHQQFSTDHVHESWHHYPIYVIDTGEFFPNGIDCSMRYGILLMDLIEGANRRDTVYLLGSKVTSEPI